MRWLEGTRARLRLLFGRRAADERMETEFRFHLEMEAERLMREAGLDRQEAWRRARVAFGGQDRYREEMREGRGPAWLTGLRLDLRHAFRGLRAAPGFTATCVLILGLGIGTTTAIFAAFDAVMLQSLPVTEPDRVVALAAQRRTGTGHALEPDELDALRRASRTLRDVAGVVSSANTMPLIEDDRPLVLDFTFVTANFFDVLGARPALGRLFRPEDAAEGAPPVTIISYQTWQREFSGDPGVLSRRLTATQLSQGPYAIVGVAPPGLDYPVGVDYWVLPGPRRQAMNVVARLMPDVTPEVARSEFLSVVQVLDRERTNPGSPTAATVRPLTEAVLGDSRPMAIAITVAVALLLLIACVNVGGLLLMRATRRVRDIMVRRALGATTGGIARLFFVESALLGIIGGLMGLGLASGLLRVLPALAPADLPRTDMIGLAASPAAVAIGVTVLSVLVFGVLPSIATARGNLASALRTEGRSVSGSRRSRRVRRSLVAGQVALAAIVLVGAGLLLRTLLRLEQLELGYQTDGVAIVELSIEREGLDGGPPEVVAMLEGVFQRIRGLPSVTSVTPVMSRPFTAGRVSLHRRPLLEGQPESEIEANPLVALESVGSGFFRTFRIPILRGRGFLEHDRDDAPKVAMVSQAVAERLWPGRDPIGERIRLSLPEEEWWTIVGVAGDTRYQRLREPTPTIYLPWRQFQVLPLVWTVAVRTERELGSLVPLMRRTLSDFSSRIVVWRTGTMTDHLAGGPLAQPRMSALLFSGFAVVALVLAAVGLYGVLALAVREQTRDLGIRRALGAPTARLRRDILRDALTITAWGTAVGLSGALLASSLLETLLFEISRADPVTLLGVSLVLLGVSAVAAYVPARRATRIDPMLALRDD